MSQQNVTEATIGSTLKFKELIKAWCNVIRRTSISIYTKRIGYTQQIDCGVQHERNQCGRCTTVKDDHIDDEAKIHQHSISHDSVDRTTFLLYP